MILKDLTVSWLRFCQDFDLSLKFVNFDATADEEALPRSSIIGPMALTFTVEEHMIEGTIQIGLSTFDDKNNFELLGKMDELLMKLLPLTKIPVYNADTGLRSGAMIVASPVTVMPIVGGKVRNLQFVAVDFKTTRTYAVPTI